MNTLHDEWHCAVFKKDLELWNLIRINELNLELLLIVDDKKISRPNSTAVKVLPLTFLLWHTHTRCKVYNQYDINDIIGDGGNTTLYDTWWDTDRKVEWMGHNPYCHSYISTQDAKNLQVDLLKLEEELRRRRDK